MEIEIDLLEPIASSQTLPEAAPVLLHFLID